jgi:hypothetical protein
MIPKMIQVLKSLAPAFGVIASQHDALSHSGFPFRQMLVVEVVIPNCWTTPPKCALGGRQPLVANAIRTLACVHQKRKRIGSQPGFKCRRFFFDKLVDRDLPRRFWLRLMGLAGVPFVAKRDHEVDYLDSQAGNLFFSQVFRLKAEYLSQSGAFRNNEVNDRLLILLFHLSASLCFDIPGWTMVEVILAIVFHNSLISLCLFRSNCVCELSYPRFAIVARDSIPALLELCALFF